MTTAHCDNDDGGRRCRLSCIGETSTKRVVREAAQALISAATRCLPRRVDCFVRRHRSQHGADSCAPHREGGRDRRSRLHPSTGDQPPHKRRLELGVLPLTSTSYSSRRRSHPDCKQRRIGATNTSDQTSGGSGIGAVPVLVCICDGLVDSCLAREPAVIVLMDESQGPMIAFIRDRVVVRHGDIGDSYSGRCSRVRSRAQTIHRKARAVTGSTYPVPTMMRKQG